MIEVSEATLRKMVPNVPATAGIGWALITAGALADKLLADKEEITEDLLAVIKVWLGAHFLAIRYMRLDSQTIGQATDVSQYKVGLNLNVTIYGQQVMVLDISGTLANAQIIASQTTCLMNISWVGKNTSDSLLVEFER